MAKMVCLGVIAAAHGIKGEVKLRAFTADPHAVASYGPLTDKAGRAFKLRLRGAPKNGVLIAAVEGVTDRNEAERLRGTELFVERARLPKPEAGEFYQADLIGLEARSGAGETLGEVVAVHDFGAGAMLEVKRAKGPSVMVPFRDEAVPEVDLAAGSVTVAMDYWLAPEGVTPDDGNGDGNEEDSAA